MQVIHLNLSSADPCALRQKSGARMLNIEVYIFPSKFNIQHWTCPLMPIGDKGSILWELCFSKK
jgi:hypothetical protein